MTLGEKIQDLRRKNAMSQDVLAEKLEVSRQAVSKWERDEAMPETDKIIRIAQLFGVTTDHLLLQEEPVAPSPVIAQEQPRSAGEPHYAFNRLERFARRHGYKGGYFMAGGGALISLICLLLRTWWRSSVESMHTSFGNITDNVQDEFGSVVGNMGFGGFGDSMFDSFNQSTQAMSSAASGWGNLFLIGLIPGVILIALGVIVIVKGKKLAKQQNG